MARATEDEQKQVMAALKAVSVSDDIEAHRDALFNALYELACQGVIPPEIKLSVEVVSDQQGEWKFRFSSDFDQWLARE